LESEPGERGWWRLERQRWWRHVGLRLTSSSTLPESLREARCCHGFWRFINMVSDSECESGCGDIPRFQEHEQRMRGRLMSF
jgi:hypothetical protein